MNVNSIATKTGVQIISKFSSKIGFSSSTIKAVNREQKKHNVLKIYSCMILQNDKTIFSKAIFTNANDFRIRFDFIFFYFVSSSFCYKWIRFYLRSLSHQQIKLTQALVIKIRHIYNYGSSTETNST